MKKDPLLEPQLVTPLASLRVSPDSPLIYAKQEYMNPSGSTKDRIARTILGKAVRAGKLKSGMVVAEASSGSTSIAMAMVCARLGLKFIAVMPKGVSSERICIIKGFGAEVHLAPAGTPMAECVEIAKSIVAQHNGFFPAQFENEDNTAAHRFGTAREAIDQVPSDRVDAVVSGVGTGGTLVGLWQGLADVGNLATPVLARPVVTDEGAASMGSCLIEPECSQFSNRIPGVMDGLSKIFVPEQMPELLTIEVKDVEALAMTRTLIKMGHPVGCSSGLNMIAALQTHATLKQRGIENPVVLTVLPDRMERYFSTELFACFREEE